MLLCDDSTRCGCVCGGRLARGTRALRSVCNVQECCGNAGDTSTRCGEVLEVAQAGLLSKGLVDNLINALL